VLIKIWGWSIIPGVESAAGQVLQFLDLYPDRCKASGREALRSRADLHEKGDKMEKVRSCKITGVSLCRDVGKWEEHRFGAYVYGFGSWPTDWQTLLH